MKELVERALAADRLKEETRKRSRRWTITERVSKALDDNAGTILKGGS